MCGLAGIAGPGITVADLDILEQLSYVSGLRGTDATGILQGRSSWKNEWTTEKESVDVNYFLWKHKYSKTGRYALFKGVQNNFFCVHTRKASVGGLSPKNAHPFEFSNIIGMHNGTLMDHRYNDKDRTDSEAMFEDMNRRGIQAVLEELSNFSAYAIVVYNKKDGCLYFARNKHRPLWTAYNKDRAVLYWASEKWMLSGILSREKQDIVENSCYFFTENCIYKLDPRTVPIGSPCPWDSKIKINPRPIPIGNKSSKKDKKYYNFMGGIPWEDTTNDNIVDVEVKEIEVEDNDKEKEEVKNLPVLSEPTKGKIPAHFCCGCNKKLKLIDQYYARSLSGNVFLCKDCNDEDENRQGVLLN